MPISVWLLSREAFLFGFMAAYQCLKSHLCLTSQTHVLHRPRLAVSDKHSAKPPWLAILRYASPATVKAESRLVRRCPLNFWVSSLRDRVSILRPRHYSLPFPLHA